MGMYIELYEMFLMQLESVLKELMKVLPAVSEKSDTMEILQSRYAFAKTHDERIKIMSLKSRLLDLEYTLVKTYHLLNQLLEILKAIKKKTFAKEHIKSSKLRSRAILEVRKFNQEQLKYFSQPVQFYLDTVSSNSYINRMLRDAGDFLAFLNLYSTLFTNTQFSIMQKEIDQAGLQLHNVKSTFEDLYGLYEDLFETARNDAVKK